MNAQNLAGLLMVTVSVFMFIFMVGPGILDLEHRHFSQPESRVLDSIVVTLVIFLFGIFLLFAKL